ncbi:Flagellar cap protein FliD [hydrothermal vent metagenome]|uniref:Filament cap protein n=1 Tax=hydrothermal vent metagenome TaxID=652676 RepID=A0A3B0WYB0_9ZZZZ
MPAISAAGIGSGLDVQSIVSQLMAIERIPLQRLQFKQSQLESQISAYGTLSSDLSAFQEAMDALGSKDALKVFTTNSTNEDVIGVTANSSANIGSFDVEVIRLAEYYKLSSDEKLNTDTFGGNAGDSISFQVGIDVADTITIDLSTAMTLSEIRTALNDDVSNPGVSATVINGDNGNQKIIFTADESGSDNAVTIAYGNTINATTLNLQTINNIAGDLSLLDAELSVDGYTVTRSTNTISDVITGITLTLKSEDVGNTQTISIDRDIESIEASVQGFADAYNALQTSLDTLRNGQLEADSSILSIERRILSILNTPATGGVYSVLSQVGLTLQKDGTMSLKNSDLQTALQTDFNGVSELFAADTDGYANRLSSFIGEWLDFDGLLETRTDGLESRIDTLVIRQESFERNLEAVESRLRARFSALDALVGQLQGTGQFLTQQLASLPGSGR